jgi:membrane protease YdiL (CAAX protease family)
MDQRSASYRTQGGAPADPLLAPFQPSRPLPPLALALSLVGIAAGGLLICCLIAVAAVLLLTAYIGVDGLTDFYQDLRFDGPLKTRIGAGVIGALYVGIAGATLLAARLRGRGAWTALVALVPIRAARRDAAAIAILTLAYAALATFVMERLQDHHMLIAGPTDLLLVGTIVANLGILAPIAEELLFRGWLYTGLRHRFSFWPSFLVTAILFAAIHWDANHRRIVMVLPLAIALGLLRERSGSIKPTIALHAVYNLVIVAITLAET